MPRRHSAPSSRLALRLEQWHPRSRAPLRGDAIAVRELGDRAGPAGRGRAEGRLARGEGGFLVPAAPRAEWRLGTGRQGVSTWVSGSVKACNRLMKKIPLLFSVSQRSTEVGRATGTATERQSWSATPGRAPPPPVPCLSAGRGHPHGLCDGTGRGWRGQDGTGQTLSLPRGLRGPPGGFTSGSDAATAAGVRLD